MKTKKNSVWKFTNGIELNKNEFLEYFEKKVFKTIRKFEMIRGNFGKPIFISSSNEINTKVLNYILKLKLQTKISSKPTFSSDNLSDSAEEIFSQILKGEFSKKKKKENRPLLYHSDKEIELYASLKDIKGITKKRDKRIQEFFKKFTDKNPDLEHNILNAFNQLE